MSRSGKQVSTTSHEICYEMPEEQSLTMKYGLQQRATEPERLDRDRWEKKWRGTIRKQQHGRVICLDTHGYVRMEHRTMLSVIKPNIWDRTELPASRMELNLCQKQISA